MALWTSTNETAVTKKEENDKVTLPAEKEDSWSTSKKNVGIDLGYGFVKLMDGTNELIFPSVVGVGKEIKFLSDSFFQKNEIENLVVTYEDRQYFVGNLAVRQSDIASRSLDQNRVTDKNAKILLLTALGLLAKWENQNFNIVTGLPTDLFGAYYMDWSKSIKGQYEVAFGSNGSKKVKKFSVKEARIIPQPFGTLYDQILSGTGAQTQQELARLVVGIVDIGFRTTDFAVANELEYIDHLSFSTNTALSSAYRIIGARLREDYKIDKENHELDRIVEQGAIRIAGKSYDLTSMKKDAYGQVATKIITELDSRWDYRDFDVILLTGGGGKALSEYLLPHFPNMRLVDRPQHANTRGFQKMANGVFSDKN